MLMKYLFDSESLSLRHRLHSRPLSKALTVQTRFLRIVHLLPTANPKGTLNYPSGAIATASTLRAGIPSAKHRTALYFQCDIIQGRLVGKLLLPSLLRRVRRDDLPEQQEQPAPWPLPRLADVAGACALRSLVAWASRRSADRPDI